MVLDFGSFVLDSDVSAAADLPAEEAALYMGFKLSARNISAFLVDGDFGWALLTNIDAKLKQSGAMTLCQPELPMTKRWTLVSCWSLSLFHVMTLVHSTDPAGFNLPKALALVGPAHTRFSVANATAGPVSRRVQTSALYRGTAVEGNVMPVQVRPLTVMRWWCHCWSAAPLSRRCNWPDSPIRGCRRCASASRSRPCISTSRPAVCTA